MENGFLLKLSRHNNRKLVIKTITKKNSNRKKGKSSYCKADRNGWKSEIKA